MSSPILSVIDPRGVATLMLNDPTRRNALSTAMISALETHLAELASQDSVRVLVITGAGKHFCGGSELAHDLTLSHGTEADNFSDAMLLTRCLRKLSDFPKPVVARINGDAFGDGLGLIACADLGLAATEAAFGCPDSRHGISPLISLPYLVNAMGSRITRHLLLTGEYVSAQEAKTYGLVTHVADEQQLDTLVNREVALLLEGSTTAHQAIKQALKELDHTSEQRDLANARLARRWAKLRMHPDTQHMLHEAAEDADSLSNTPSDTPAK